MNLPAGPLILARRKTKEATNEQTRAEEAQHFLQVQVLQLHRQVKDNCEAVLALQAEVTQLREQAKVDRQERERVFFVSAECKIKESNIV